MYVCVCVGGGGGLLFCFFILLGGFFLGGGGVLCGICLYNWSSKRWTNNDHKAALLNMGETPLWDL